MEITFRNVLQFANRNAVGRAVNEKWFTNPVTYPPLHALQTSGVSLEGKTYAGIIGILVGSELIVVR